jgi:uncharacterized membrane protein (UPF0182 family)
MRASSDIPRRFSLANRRTRWTLVIAFVALIVLVASAQHLASFYTDFLWFQSVGLSSVWVKTITIETGLGVTFTVLLFALLWGNLSLADRLAPNATTLAPTDELVARWQELASAHMRWIRLAVCAAFALIGGLSAHSQWNNWLLFSNAQPFSASSAPWKGLDPLNHMNDSFYVFKLPFLSWLVGWAFSALIVTLLLCLVAHYLNGGIRPHSAMQRVSRQVKAHLSVLLAALALVEGVNYYLQRLSLVLSTKYPVLNGATYTDVHAVRPALLLLIAISVIAAGLFLYNVRQQGWLLPSVAVALWGLVWILVANVYPAIVQAVVVKPAENAKEAPYLAENIEATTWAYGLENVQSQTFQGNATIAASEVTGKSRSAVTNQQSLANVPLLDADVAGMNSVFNKSQGFRGYYTMSGPSADRYDLPLGPGGKSTETQVLVSARQLYSAEAPGSWVNQVLQYTHGYGAVVAPANQAGVQSDGSPNFTLQGLPPSGVPSINVQPRIYFDISPGSQTGYVIANSDQPELDYQDPLTQNEKETHYTGEGGVAMGGFLRRLAFAFSFSSPNIVLSDDIDSNSRILYNRNVIQRLEKAAPFLSYDSDPYPVVLNGRLYWVADAYTTTDNFPYSEQATSDPDFGRLPSSNYGLSTESFNYVRNSVKCVVDAYTGQMWFFVMQTQTPDPIIETYMQAFPKLFTPVSKADSLIPGITGHWRYPEDLFTVQTNMYSTYHQQQENVFYANSQAWGIAQNPAAGEVTVAATTVPSALAAPTLAPPPPDVLPEYELVALPGQTNQSFVLVQPFQPASVSGQKQNLTAFMTASSDPSDYGALNVYAIPSGQSVDGPYQVTSAIEQNTSISEEISLLGQKGSGSKVVLGDVMLTPIGQSLVYTQPLYIEQQTNQVPRLGDVIVVYDNTAFHSGTTHPTLAAALCQVTNPSGGHPFASYCSQVPSSTPTVPSTPTKPTHPSTTTTTTTTSVPAATTTTQPSTPSSHSTLAQDLAIATQDFAAADQALKEGDLGTYQNDVRAAEAAVALAYKLETATGTTTTVVAGPPTSAPKAAHKK